MPVDSGTAADRLQFAGPTRKLTAKKKGAKKPVRKTVGKKKAPARKRTTKRK